MKQITNDEGLLVDYIMDTEEVADRKQTIVTFAFSFRYKDSQLRNLRTQYERSPEKKDKLAQNFIMSKMKKIKGAVLHPGDYEEHYEVFANIIGFGGTL